ncbi:hypothetical protein [Deinococcus marmoris]|uniref:hypothetical protein n=1 Tax=Deinococcus marmoris TaxID=249408 RepID=UPI0012DF02A1|nr:hypothetical protein [Deinococcus marmoris]
MLKNMAQIVLGFSMLLGTAQAAPVLGQRIDLTQGAATALRSTGICAELSCDTAVIAKIDVDIIYLGALDQGAFTYLVNGRVAMVGWMGRPHGEMPRTPSLAQFNRLAQKVASTSLPQSWLKATSQNWDQSIGLDPDKVTRITQSNAVFGGKTGNGAWYTLYIAQPAHEARLRLLINRVEPKNARAIADRFMRDMGGPLSARRDQCPANTKPLIAIQLLDNRSYASFDAYFKRLGMPSTGCCGGPPTWALPGLSASSVSVETRNFNSTNGDEMPNGCVSGQ